ncbi:MAG TPA: mechanosensitive ion channel family protein [Candidatus Omnitrophica bacterium]|nr:mechanosensitive ion channel family protein [Candidatus Omnitrophota bacterium]
MDSIREILSRTFLNFTIWDYVLIFITILTALAVNKIVGYILRNKLKPLAKRTRTKIDELFLHAIDGPLAFFVFVIAFFIITHRFFQGPLINKIFQILVSINVAYLLIKLVDVLEVYLSPIAKRTESKLDEQLLPIIKRSLKIFIAVMAVMIIVDNLGYNIKTILAGLGIGGLAFALAGKDILSNFFGSIIIFADRPFEVGDRVVVGNYDGIIETIGMRSTRLRTLDGTLVAIPNSTMANSSINNIAKRPTIKNLFTLSLTYNTSYDKMKEALDILRDIYKNHPSTENYWVYFNKYGAHSLEILVIHWCKYTKYEEYLKATEEINLEIKRRFEEKGIEFAFPTQTIYVKKE